MPMTHCPEQTNLAFKGNGNIDGFNLIVPTTYKAEQLPFLLFVLF